MAKLPPALIPTLCLLAATAPRLCALDLPPGARADLYHDRWIDFDKDGKKSVYEDASAQVEDRVEDILGRMTLDEKTAQLATLYGYGRVLKEPLPSPAWKTRAWKDGIANIDEMHNGVGQPAGKTTPYYATPADTVKALNEVQRWFIEETRLGIPVEYTNEGIRGACYYRSTNFPALLSLGATWDRDLVRRVFSVVGEESKALGYRNVYAPIMDLARDPRWGRTVECFGEDPYLVAEMGLQTTKAIRATGIISTAKHFAVYSEPKGGRDGNARTDPHVSPREVERLHLRPWERLVKEGGLLGAMSSYNDYDGVPISGAHEFLIDRLRKAWGFKGYVVSDSWAVEYLYQKHKVVGSQEEAASLFLREGGNVRTTFDTPETFLERVRSEVRAGHLSESVVNDRVRDVLRVKFIEGLFDQPYGDPARADATLHSASSQELALEAARKSIVLLRNRDHTLPLANTIKRLLVTGPTAAIKETSLDRYGSHGGEVISALEGIENFGRQHGIEVLNTPGCAIADEGWPDSEVLGIEPTKADLDHLQEAVTLAKSVDAVVVCVGDSMATVGESLSRTSLELPGLQNRLIRELVETGKPVVVVLLSGRPATVNWADRHAGAVVEAWFPGEKGGTAIAEVLFGEVNPSGKLPITFPRTVGQLPMNFPFKPGSHAKQSRTYDPNGSGSSSVEGMLYPFGHGLSYTEFTYSDLGFSAQEVRAGEDIDVTVRVTNTGSRAGEEIVQLYFRDEVSSVTTYELNLCDFTRVMLAAGESKVVHLRVPSRELELINREGKRLVEPGTFLVKVGASSEDLRLEGRFTVLP